MIPLSDDMLDLIECLNKHHVNYLLVGGFAMIVYESVRLTGDMDIFYKVEDANIEKLYLALRDFWDGKIPGIAKPNDLGKIGQIIQFGQPPNRIDLLNAIDGVSFEECETTRVLSTVRRNSREITFPVIGLVQLYRNKVASGRLKDVADAEWIASTLKKSKS